MGELIHLASFKKKTEIVKKLIEKYNVDPNIVSEIVSPLLNSVVECLLGWSSTSAYSCCTWKY